MSAPLIGPSPHFCFPLELLPDYEQSQTTHFTTTEFNITPRKVVIHSLEKMY